MSRAEYKLSFPDRRTPEERQAERDFWTSVYTNGHFQTEAEANRALVEYNQALEAHYMAKFRDFATDAGWEMP